uniref:Secreted protein n=1 Tax=Heterorhabditis bacteriophora TaxID=37862 RepID=A0A1I7WHE0_HETBA
MQFISLTLLVLYKYLQQHHDSTISSLGENDNNGNVTIHGNTSDYHTLIKSKYILNKYIQRETVFYLNFDSYFYHNDSFIKHILVKIVVFIEILLLR